MKVTINANCPVCGKPNKRLKVTCVIELCKKEKKKELKSIIFKHKYIIHITTVNEKYAFFKKIKILQKKKREFC